MNKRQIKKKNKKEWRKFFAERLHDVGWDVKPSRVRLLTKTKEDRIIMYGYNGHKAIELSLICKKEESENEKDKDKGDNFIHDAESR